MKAKAWDRRLGKIVIPDRAETAHAAWLRRGLKLLTDKEMDELERLQARVVAVTLDGRRTESCIVANPPTRLPAMKRAQSP